MKAQEFLTETFPFKHKNKIYSLLINKIGSGPFDGGCVVFARALQIKFGGSIVALVGHAQLDTNQVAQHAAILLDGMLIDADGLAAPKDFVRRFVNNELAHTGGSITGVRELQPGDLPDAPRNEQLSRKITKLL